MRSLFVYADFDFLPAPCLIGTLNYDRVRGNEVYSFSYSPQWLSDYGGIVLSKDLFTTSGPQYAQDGIFGCFSDSLGQDLGRKTRSHSGPKRETSTPFSRIIRLPALHR